MPGNNPGSINLVSQPWGREHILKANAGEALTHLGHSPFSAGLVGVADLAAHLAALGVGAPLAAIADDADNKTVAATLQMDHVRSVRWYGAPGDGTNQTAAIQAAINAVQTAGGGVVVFPAGTYVATVTANKTVHLIGAGVGVTILEAVNAGEYALTLDDSGGNQLVHGLSFRGVGRTKHGIHKLNGVAGGTAALLVSKCTFSECGRMFFADGCFYWHFQDCMAVDNGYDWYIDSLPAMQASSGLIEHCYSSGNRQAAIRSDSGQYELMIRAGVIEQTAGFVVYAVGHNDGYPIVLDGVHLEGNCTAGTVDIDGVPTVPYEFHFSGVRDVTIRDMMLKSLSVAGGTAVTLERCTMDADAWTFVTDGGTTWEVIAKDCKPYSATSVGTCVNDIFHVGRRLTSAFARVSVAPGPLTDRLAWHQSNLFNRGSMANEYAVTDARTNTVGFSTGYAAPLWTRCMTIAFAGTGQAYTAGVTLFPSWTATQNKWYVWSLDLRSVATEGYLSAAWKSGATQYLPSASMRAYTDRWTRYWGVCRFTGTTGASAPVVWNAHASLNPTFLLANVQLVEFADAQAALQYIEDAAFAPESNMARPAAGMIAKTGDYAIVIGDNGQHFSNTGAGAAVTLALLAASPGRRVTATRIASQALRLDPSGTETIKGGGAGKYLELGSDGATVTLEYLTTGTWYVAHSEGTITFQP